MAEPASYRYDVFISYHPRDGDWVWNWLLPRLEQAGLRVCIDQNCFQPGAPVATEIERAVNESRRTLAVMTPAWVESQWDQFESLLIQQKDAAARLRRLIPIQLKSCDPPDRIKLLQWVDFTDAGRQEEQLGRVIDDIKGVSTLPELRRDVFPEPKQRRWELRWFAVAGVAAVLTLVVLVGWIWWQNRKPMRMPENEFNIAVAEFEVLNENGEPLQSKEGKERANQIARFLSDEATSLGDIVALRVNIAGPEQLSMPRITDANAEENAKVLNATVLVYGHMSQMTNGGWSFEPKLFFTESAVKNLADELRGSQAMGKPMLLATGIGGASDFNREMQTRMRALTPLLLGLVKYSDGSQASYQQATDYFRKAVASAWGQGTDQGQEILYLFLGNALAKTASLETDNPEVQHTLLEESETAFRQAIKLNPEYPRTYNGLGATLFQLARLRAVAEGSICGWDWDRLQAAFDSHAQAQKLYSSSSSDSGDIIVRSEVGMGRTRFWQGIGQRWCKVYPEADDFWQEALERYEVVLSAYESEPKLWPARHLVAQIAATDSAYMQLREAINCLSDDCDPHPLLDEAIRLYDKVNAIAGEAKTEEAKKQADSITPYLAQARCLIQQPDASAALDECPDP